MGGHHLLAVLAFCIGAAIAQSPPQQTVEVKWGSTVTLRCMTEDGGSTSRFYWTTPDRQNQRTNVIRVTMNSMRKYGRYQCTATVNRRRQISVVNVIRPILRKFTTRDLKNVELGKALTLTCPIDFGPRNTNWLMWDSIQKAWVQKRGRGQNIYRIRRAGPTDMTVWRCESANGRPVGGQYSAEYRLHAGFHKSAQAELTGLNEIDAESTPVIVPEGQPRFSMECEPVGSGSGEGIQWQFRPSAPNSDYVAVGRDAMPVPNMAMAAQADLSVLEIDNCNTQNSGFYRCTLSDGSARYAKLTVAKTTPEIHRYGKQSRNVDKKADVAYHCGLSSTTADPQLIEWEFRPRGKEKDPLAGITFQRDIPNDFGITVKLVRDRSRLEIKSAEKRHEGRFFCIYKTQRDYTDLTVGSGIVATLTGTYDSRFTYYNLRCNAKMVVPLPNNRRPYFRYTFFEQKNGGQKLKLRTGRVDAFSTDERLFSCEAREAFTGKTATSNILTVSPAKLTLTPVTVLGIRQGAKMEMRCTINNKNVRPVSLTLLKDRRSAPFTRNKTPLTTGTEASMTFNYSPARTSYSGTYTCRLGRMISNEVKFIVCRTDQRICRDNSRCYEKRQQCDKRNDCADGSDEERNQCMDCEPHSLPCQRYRGRDPEIKCVLKHWICDSQDDCGNGWDEVFNKLVNPYCTTHPVPRNCPGCGRNETCCSDGRCFPRAYECDKETDCPADQGDEALCQCDPGSAGIEVEEPLVETVKAVRVGETVTLMCRVRSKERPTVNWRFNWGHLPDDKRFKESMTVVSTLPGLDITGAQEMYTVEGTLVITGVKKETDFGRYTCEAITKCKRKLAPDYILREDVLPPL